MRGEEEKRGWCLAAVQFREQVLGFVGELSWFQGIKCPFTSPQLAISRHRMMANYQVFTFGSIPEA